MISPGQKLTQRQSLQQRLSPQQIQYIKLLQLPTIALEQRIKEEMEENPVLEEVETEEWEEDSAEQEDPDLADTTAEEGGEADDEDAEVDPVDNNEEIDWESFMANDEPEGSHLTSNYNPDEEEWRNLPKPYNETLLEGLESQVGLLNLNEREELIADEIIGSLDSDGYFRRDLSAVIDSIAFNEGILVTDEEAEAVLKQIQQLDPPGIAARDLRECLLIQLEMLEEETPGCETAIKTLRDYWELFEKKHYDKLQRRLDVSEEELKEAFECLRYLDPKPGSVDTVQDSHNYIVPDFIVYYQPAVDDEGNEDPDQDGEFIITMNNRNAPKLQVSPKYKEMWDDLNKSNGSKSPVETKETKTFIKNKIESARWFIECIQQRQQTLMNVMQTIVALQEDFFKHGDGLKPMILKDISERIGMDISTVSRVVNGKYVQTPFGVYELKYFFNEGLETESGEEVSNREVKNHLQELIDNEEKKRPLSDQALAKKMQEKGFMIARRTVSKYREQLNIPVARLRKEI